MRAVVTAVLVASQASAWAQPSPEIWSRAIIPESPETAPATLELPGPWKAQMDDAIAATQREGTEFGGCLIYDLLPVERERRDRVADAVLSADAAAMPAALRELGEVTRAARTNGPVVGANFGGSAYSMEEHANCGGLGAEFHTHPGTESAVYAMLNFPSGTDLGSGMMAALRWRVRQPTIRVIRSASGYYALVPTKKAVDSLDYGVKTRKRVSFVLSAREAWDEDAVLDDKYAAALMDLALLPNVACRGRSPDLLVNQTCMMDIAARMGAVAGFAVYFGDTRGVLRRATAGSGAADVSFRVDLPYRVSANVVAAASKPPQHPGDLLQEPRWELLVPAATREAYAVFRPWFEKAGLNLTDAHLAYLGRHQQGGTKFRGTENDGWPGISRSLVNMGASSAEGITAWRGEIACAFLATAHWPERYFTMLAERRIPKKAESLRDVQLLEGGRTAIVVATAQNVLGTALLGRVTGGVPVYEGELPVKWEPQGTVTWKGRFMASPEGRCKGTPYIADGPGVGEYREKDGRLGFSFRGTASAGKFTGEFLDREGRVHRTVRDFPDLVR